MTAIEFPNSPQEAGAEPHGGPLHIRDVADNANELVDSLKDVVADLRAGKLGINGSVGPWVWPMFTIPKLPFDVRLGP